VTYALALVIGFLCGRAIGQREGTAEDRERANQEMGPEWLERMYS
jgi:hypothetical protein